MYYISVNISLVIQNHFLYLSMQLITFSDLADFLPMKNLVYQIVLCNEHCEI